MALSFATKHWFLLFVVVLSIASCCNSDVGSNEIVGRAVSCFNSHVYSRCQESYRLNAEGVINVPREATDVYCDGPCFDETRLLLNCIDGILYNFQFYNGASTRDVRYGLRTGCGHTGRRGDFNALGRLNSGFGGDYDGYGDYDHSTRLDVPLLSLLAISSFVLLFWAF